MPQLSNLAEEYKTMQASANHVLLIGGSKTGKTDWVAQAAIDGFDILYIDKDNGLSTLMERISKFPEAMERVHYLSPIDYTEFMTLLLTAPVIRYNERTREPYQSSRARPEDEIIEIRPLRIARNRNVIVSFDSLTTLALEFLKDAAKKRQKELTEIDKYSREIYGPAGFQATNVMAGLQLAPFNFILQAHPSVYEIREKPANRVAEEIEEREMIIKETWDIPMSTSNPHGFSIGKFFNQIGWLELRSGDRFILSFKQRARRIVGGTPGSEGDPRSTHTYKNLFGKGMTLPVPMDEEAPWIRRLTAAQYQEEQGKKPAGNQTTAPAANQAPVPQLATTGALKVPAGIKLGNT